MPTDFAATIYVDQRLESAGFVDKTGTGMLERNAKPTLAAVMDGLSNTIMYAESAGRPHLYRQGKLVSEDLTEARVNEGVVPSGDRDQHRWLHQEWRSPAGPMCDQLHKQKRFRQQSVPASLLRVLRQRGSLRLP